MEDDIELLRLRARAKLKQEQEQQRQQEVDSAPQQELGTMDYLNFTGGLVRGALAGAAEPLVGKDLVSREQVATGTVPGSKELAEKAGVDLTYMYPGFVRNLAKLTGQEENLKSLAGATADVAFDPLSYAPVGKAVSAVAKGVSEIPVVAKGIEMASPVVSSIAEGAKGMASKAGTKAMSLLSGVPEESIQTFAKNKQVISELDPVKAAELAEQATNDARKLVVEARTNAGKALDQAIAQGGSKPINIQDFKDKLYKSIIGSVGDLKNINNQEIAAGLKKELDNMFLVDVPEVGGTGLMGEQVLTGRTITKEIPSQLKATEVYDLKNQLKDMGDLYGGHGGIVSKQAAAKIPVANKKVQVELLDAVKNLDSMIDDATQGVSKEARAAYAEQSRKASNIDRYFSTPDRALSTLSNLSSTAKGATRKAIREADTLFGTNLEQTGKMLESAKYFNQPSIEALSLNKTTSSTRTLGGGAVGAFLGSLIGGPTGAALGMGIGAKAVSPAAIRYAYLPTGELVGNVMGKAGPIATSAAKVPPQVWLQMIQNKENK